MADEVKANRAAAAASPPPEETDWPTLLGEAAKEGYPVVDAQTFDRGPWASFSKPVCVKCADGVFRVIKGVQAGTRALFNDHVVARLAQKIRAPVPEPAIVNLPQALIDMEPRLQHMVSGLCHGSRFLDGHSDRQGVTFTSLDANRSRFASLAILYGWAFASDHQQIYPNAPPHHVLSVDHGHFIGDGPDWSPSLLEARPAAHADEVISRGATLTKEELQRAASALTTVTRADVAAAVASAPPTWQIPDADRVAVSEYFWRRRGELLSAYVLEAKTRLVEVGGD